MEKKNIIIILIIIAIIVLAIFIITNKKQKKGVSELNKIEEVVYVEKLEDGTEVNMTSKIQKVNKIQGLEGIEISNVQLTKKEEQIAFSAKATNKSNKILGDTEINIVFKGKDGQEIMNITGYLESIEQGKEKNINARQMTTIECSELYEMMLEVKQ